MKQAADKMIAAYIEGIYAAGDSIKAGVRVQNAAEIFDAVNVFSITKNFRRGENTATAWDVRAAAEFWQGQADRARAVNKPSDAALYDRTAGAFLGILRACRG